MDKNDISLYHKTTAQFIDLDSDISSKYLCETQKKEG